MSTQPVVITVRALGSDGEPQYGQSQANYLTNLQAVAQIILTRLRLFQGEWWAATNDGTPMFQNILGGSASQANQKQDELIISGRILGSPYVLAIVTAQTSYASATRAFQYAAVVSTQFGQLTVTNIPQPPSGAI